MDISSRSITITFGDVCENHARMQKLGTLANEGFSVDVLKIAKKEFEERGRDGDLVACELFSLNDLLLRAHGTQIGETEFSNINEAMVLVIRNGVSLFCDSEKLKAELDNLNWDKKALMYGRVVNKNARHNLCFADVSQEADYKSGKGTVIPFDSVPCLATVRGRLSEFLGASGENLFAEGNYYFDLKNCGIGFHGDSERRKVVAMRVGASNPIVFQWFFKNNPVGIPIRIDLNDGDMYIMSDKAVGNDWKKSSIYTLRHAAGAEKFLKYKPKKALQKKKQHEQHVDMRDEPSLKRTKIETTDLLKN